MRWFKEALSQTRGDREVKRNRDNMILRKDNANPQAEEAKTPENNIFLQRSKEFLTIQNF